MGKTVWIIWDGASYPLIVDLLQRGTLPHLQRVVTRGALAAMRPPGPNCETPPGLMTLFTGCEEPMHGVPGFVGLRQPLSRHSVLETISGFDASWLRRPPVWVEAAARGRTITLAATAFAPDPLQASPYPWPYPTASYRCVLDGYRHAVAEAQLLSLPDHATTVKIANCQLAITRRETLRHIRSPGGQWLALPILQQPEELVPLWLDTATGVGVYVARLRASGERHAAAQEWLWCSAVTRLVTQPAGLWPAAWGPFLGAGIGWHFSRGVLGKGPRLPLAVLEAITRRVARFFGDMAVWTLTSCPADLVVLYQPALDEIAHQLLHHALSDWPQGKAAQAVVAVHQEVDRQLGRLLEYLGHEDTLIISSDHGQTPITAAVRPNILLRQAGLLAFKGDKVDLERTRALFLSNGWVVIILHNIVAVASRHQRMRRHCRTSNTACKRPCVYRTGKHCVCNAGVTSGWIRRQHRGTLLSGPQRPLSSDPTSLVHSMVPQKSGDTTRRPYNRPRICRHSSPAVDRV